ncbi:hypothetical protein Bbelb_352590 [Branchiostoma belcheri]|nr:hypothetical protein Bbelb_352590 [Branchiostoma belcheri]
MSVITTEDANPYCYYCTDINECATKPCQHGRCVNKDGGYKCICLPGWTGQNCQQGRAGQSHRAAPSFLRAGTFPVLGGIRAHPPAHASAPPTPAAACIAKFSSQDDAIVEDARLFGSGKGLRRNSEPLPLPWEDVLPLTFRFEDLNECTRNPCQHGRCMNKDGGYKCTCNPGWTGQNCQQDINECARNPCQHVRCVNKDGGYTCICLPGWTGQNCQQKISKCTRNSCQHGRCVNKDGGYKCTCSPGWTGQNCRQGVNLALGKPAYQTSTHDGPADRAVDGNTNGKYYQAGSCTHTVHVGGGETDPSWWVDLGQSYKVDRILTVRRLDGISSRAGWQGRETYRGHRPIRRPARARSRQACHDTLQTRLTNSQKRLIGRGKTAAQTSTKKMDCETIILAKLKQDERLNPFNIHIGDSDLVSENPKCGGDHQIAVNQPSISVPCQGMKGRYVGVRLPGPTRKLTLCEVQVFSETVLISPSTKSCRGWSAFIMALGSFTAASSRRSLSVGRLGTSRPPPRESSPLESLNSQLLLFAAAN